MQTRAPYQPQPESTCAKVMAFARQRNSRELMRLLRDGYALHERSLGRDAISYLAEAGDFHAARYLIDRFVAFYKPFKSLMLGAAIGGHDQTVDHYFEMYKGSEESHLNDNLHFALACSYALGGHVNQANARLNKVSSPKIRYHKIHQIIYHYALNGSCQSEIDAYFKKIAHIACVVNKAEDEIRSDFENAVKQAYAKRGLIEDEGFVVYSAMGGQEEFVHRVLAGALRTDNVVSSDFDSETLNLARLLARVEYLNRLILPVSMAALNYSPTFAFNVIKYKFSDMDTLIHHIIDHGHLGEAFNWLPLLHENYFIMEILNFESQAAVRRINTNASESPGAFAERFSRFVECNNKYLEGKYLFDAEQKNKFLERIDSGVRDKARLASSDRFRIFLFGEITYFVQKRRYAAVHMLCQSWRSIFGSVELPDLCLEGELRLDEDEIHFMAASIDDSEFRRELTSELIIESFGRRDLDVKLDVIVNHAALVNRLMRHYLLDVHQAIVIMGSNAVDARHWLQVYRFSDDNLSLPTNVFSAIFSVLLGVNEIDAQMIYEAMLLNIFERQPTGMYLQKKLDVFGLFKPALPSGDHTPGNDRPFLRC